MIDIFNELFTLLKNALATYDTNIKTASVYTNMPSSYPFVSFEEINNSVHEATSDSCDIEEHADIEYEVNIYTQNPQKKSNADKIASVVDNLLKTYNFVRTTKNVFQSPDETTYRVVIRYSGVVSKDHTIYRR